MASKARGPSANSTQPAASNELRIEGAANDTTEQRVAKVALGPTVLNAITTLTYSKRRFGTISIEAACHALDGSIKSLRGGDLSGAEAVLISQATALNSIFNDLAMRSYEQSQMQHLDTFLRLAMKAQNQCRMTLETLATIKNPPVVFARQANISHGPQQVNNGAATDPVAHAAKIGNTQTELLEASDGKRLDTRATGTAGSADPQLETVGAVHRPTHRKGQGTDCAQRVQGRVAARNSGTNEEHERFAPRAARSVAARR